MFYDRHYTVMFMAGRLSAVNKLHSYLFYFCKQGLENILKKEIFTVQKVAKKPRET